MMMSSTSSLEKFFIELPLPTSEIDGYVSKLTAMGIDNEKDLRCFASIWNLTKIGMGDSDIQNVMQTLFVTRPSELDVTECFHLKRRDEGAPCKLPAYQEPLYPPRIGKPPRLSRNSVIVFQEIGRGGSGRVSKALFVPTLTLVAIKRIEIKDAITRKVVSQELKFLYEVAQSHLDLSLQISTDDHQLLSGQLYSDVIAGYHSPLESPPVSKHTWQAAYCPYIISFFDAYIDPEYGAVCLVLEYMNGGSIQSMLTGGRRFDEDDAAVLAFSVLNALIELHSRNILHRDIKPSNILSDFDGRVKLTDFGITKEMVDENKCADSFIGTLAYMSPNQVCGNSYSFEADMWSLGITMITIMTGRPPFPTDRGPWHLMNAIIQGPQPFLEADSVSLDLHSFIHECLNQQHQDSKCAVKLLGHRFLTSARNRGILPQNTPAILLHPASPPCSSDIPADVIDKIVEAAISWQLEGIEDQFFEEGGVGPFDKLPRFATAKVHGLAKQMLIEPSYLEGKFESKYLEIDALCEEEWSIDGLRKVVWPKRDRSKSVALNTPEEAFGAQMYNTCTGNVKSSATNSTSTE